MCIRDRLFAAVDRGDRLVTWRQGRSLPYGEGVSYWALGEMVKAQAGVLETDAPDEAARKLREAVERLVADETEAAWVETHLGPLAGLAGDDETADRRGEAFAAWRRFFEALAEQRPVVLVFEDLHWADDGLLDFVDHLVDWLTDVPVLVVASARPELLARRPTWGGGKPNATTISLAPLSNDETATLVHALLEQSVLPAEVQSALLEPAGGNPLYAEEFVRLVAERGHEGAELPESVQAIIAARLDALEREDKELLQDAAVVGKVFWSGALAGIGKRERFDVEQRLHALERRELVRRERRSSVAISSASRPNAIADSLSPASIAYRDASASVRAAARVTPRSRTSSSASASSARARSVSPPCHNASASSTIASAALSSSPAARSASRACSSAAKRRASAARCSAVPSRNSTCGRTSASSPSSSASS